MDIDHLAALQIGGVELLSSQRTPLQKMIENLFRALFGLVIFFAISLFIESFILKTNTASEIYWDTFSIIFGIAPTSLFFILIVHYTVGSLRIADQGALMYQSQSIESLANVSVLCVSKESVLSGIQLSLTPLTPPVGYEPLSENLMRHILGDIVNSVPLLSPTGNTLAASLSGTQRETTAVAPFLQVLGWYGVTFDEADLRGTFVIGEPGVLESQLAQSKSNIVDQALEETGRDLRHWLRNLRQQTDMEATADTPETAVKNTNINRPTLTTQRSTTKPSGSARQPDYAN